MGKYVARGQDNNRCASWLRAKYFPVQPYLQSMTLNLGHIALIPVFVSSNVVLKWFFGGLCPSSRPTLGGKGKRGRGLEWFRSYLIGRKQSVRIGCKTSEPRLVSYGVPQGSILGPALFNIYINDLPSVPKVVSLECYVDDSQLYLSFPVRDATLAAT